MKWIDLIGDIIGAVAVFAAPCMLFFILWALQ